MLISKWDLRFLELANLVSTWSKDPSTTVGCVIVKDRRILSTGFNGHPANCSDDLEFYLNRETKLNRIVHAEANAITQCALFGVSTQGCTLYGSLFPCLDCAKLIISSGIIRVVSPAPEITSRWYSSFQLSNRLMIEAGLIINTVQEDLILKK